MLTLMRNYSNETGSPPPIMFKNKLTWFRPISTQRPSESFQTALFYLFVIDLFDILNLFAHLLDQNFQFNRRLRAFGGDGFAAQSISFTV